MKRTTIHHEIQHEGTSIIRYFVVIRTKSQVGKIWEKWQQRSTDKLPEFQKYLLEKNLAPAKNVPFYAHWVSRFLDYARGNEFSALEYQESAVLGSLEFLKSDSHIQDWQHRQAK